MTVHLQPDSQGVREKVWKVIRGLLGFTFDEVAITAELPYAKASAYLKALYQAGYIRQAGKKEGIDGRKKVFWRLVRNTGPKAPAPCKCLYDPNIDEVNQADTQASQKAGKKKAVRPRSGVHHVD